MTAITDCPLCELRFSREHELIDHLRADHHGERSAALADLIERTAHERRAQRRRRTGGQAGRGAPRRA
jgi:hypothetical protein